jgi:hypothetical protein
MPNVSIAEIVYQSHIKISHIHIITSMNTMDTNKMIKVLSGHLEHFPLCEKFGTMVVAMSKCLQDYVETEDEAINILYAAAGANLAARVDRASMDVDDEHVIKYCAVGRALLDKLREDAQEDDGQQAEENDQH